METNFKQEEKIYLNDSNFDDFDDIQIKKESVEDEAMSKEINTNSLDLVVKSEELKKNDAFTRSLSKYNNIVGLIKSYISTKKENKEHYYPTKN